MKSNYVLVIVILLIILISILLVTYRREFKPRWDFSEDLEGWSITHGLKVISSEGVLELKVVGYDPYLHSPPINLDAGVYRLLKIRVAATSSFMLKVYWIRLDDTEWDERKSYAFPIRADGEFHEYVIDLGVHPEWKGRILQIRLDLEPPNVINASLLIDYVALTQLPVNFEIIVSTDKAIPVDGEEFKLKVKIVNKGRRLANLKVEAFLNNLKLFLKDINRIENKEKLEETIKLKLNEGVYTVKVLINTQDYGTIIHEEELVIARRNPLNLSKEDLTLNLRGFRIVVVKGINGYTSLLLWSNNKLLAVIHPLSKIAFKETKHKVLALIPTTAKVLDNEIVLTGSREGFNYTFKFRKEGEMLKTVYLVNLEKTYNITHFRGPWLHIGEKSFGSNKTAALLPGLEWLVGEEKSSSTLDVYLPHNLRLVPHPLKITITCAGIEAENYLVGLLWDPVWPQPSLVFSSPNWFEGQDNHLIGLFVPWAGENSFYSLEEMKASSSLKVESFIIVVPNGMVVDLVPYWLKVYGLPDNSLPRDFIDEITLCRMGYQNIWDDEVKGWAHAIDAGTELSTPRPYAKYALLLLLDYYVTGSRDALNMSSKAIEKLVKERSVGYLSTTDGCHVTENILPFILGKVPSGLKFLRNVAYSFRNSMRPDGTWGYSKSMSIGGRVLGKEGETAIGLNAFRVALMLRYVRFTGDKNILEASLKALEAMDRFKVPRAAQVWEIPVHTPDLLASARAVDAYLEAYLVTGDRKYLIKAVYWAKTGLPFIYFWTSNDIEVMAYSTIPVFGATFYTHPWFGIPVQWNGLVYAYEILRLSYYDNSLPWREIAKGILASAMKQQATEGKYKGLYPDSWNLQTNAPQPPWINPEAILNVLYLLHGIRLDLDTRHVDNLKILSTTTIMEVKVSNNEISIVLSTNPLPRNLIVVYGVKPSQVLVDGRELPFKDKVSLDVEGWTISEGYVLIVTSSREVKIKC